MKRWAAVEVVWQDAHGDDQGWEVLDEDRHSAADIRSVGMMHTRNKKGITLVLSKMLDHPTIAAYIFIPVGRIVSVRELT